MQLLTYFLVLHMAFPRVLTTPQILWDRKKPRAHSIRFSNTLNNNGTRQQQNKWDALCVRTFKWHAALLCDYFRLFLARFYIASVSDVCKVIIKFQFSATLEKLFLLYGPGRERKRLFSFHRSFCMPLCWCNFSFRGRTSQPCERSAVRDLARRYAVTIKWIPIHNKWFTCFPVAVRENAHSPKWGFFLAWKLGFGATN